MIKMHSRLKEIDLKGKRVLVRADLNVPLNKGAIVNDYRLHAVLPTLREIQKKGGKIILATHIGRPKGPDATLSTRHLIPWFEQQGFFVDFEGNLDSARTQSFENPKALLLLENLRFFPGEKAADSEFAQTLANLGDIYVNDAFALLHRADTSITLVPKLFAQENRTIGFLIERELSMLNKLLDPSDRPFVLILGGGKVSDKLPLLNAMLNRAQIILLGPAVSFTFSKALGDPVGASLVEDDLLNTARQFLAQAQKAGVKVLLPVDYIGAQGSFDGPLVEHPFDTANFPPTAVGVSIGPKTASLFASEIASAKTVFCNGLMGSARKPETLLNVATLYKSMAESHAFTVVGGGDSVAAAYLLGYADKLGYLSTGGGATLAYLSGQPLPGLKPYMP